MNFTLTAEFKFNEPLHFGTGLSHAGVADRTISLDSGGHPVLRGEAIKGAVRGMAERLVRWLAGGVPQEQEAHSIPPPGALTRLFRGSPGSGPFYRFNAGVYIDGGQLQQIAATRVDSTTGVAAAQTLRVLQSWTPGARFAVTIRGFQGEWDQPGHRDYHDLTLLIAALLCTDSIGGRKGTGHGGLQVSCLNSPEIVLPRPEEVDRIEALRQYLNAEGLAHA